MPKIIPSEPKTYEKPSVGKRVGGVLASAVVSKLVKSPIQLSNPLVLKKMQNIGDSLSIDNLQKVEKGVENLVKNSGLADKGVSII